MLVAALDPTDAAEAASLIARAAALDDAELELFLTALADRVRSSGEPVTAAELRSWLDAWPRGA
jgi:hypothetical protein